MPPSGSLTRLPQGYIGIFHHRLPKLSSHPHPHSEKLALDKAKLIDIPSNGEELRTISEHLKTRFITKTEIIELRIK